MHTQTVVAFGSMRSNGSWFIVRRVSENKSENLSHSFMLGLAVNDVVLAYFNFQLRLRFTSMFLENIFGKSSCIETSLLLRVYKAERTSWSESRYLI